MLQLLQLGHSVSELGKSWSRSVAPSSKNPLLVGVSQNRVRRLTLRTDEVVM